jgi:ABC-type bacteriocin/lantibiotic exporter with double-glycine peptidase domain
VKQRDQFCGPASLSSVFTYYNLYIDQDEIAKEVYVPKLKGALITDLENYAKKKGFQTELFRGDLEKLRQYISRGLPVIILVDLGVLFVSVPHYLVMVGFDLEGFYAHTGYEEMKFYPSKSWIKSGERWEGWAWWFIPLEFFLKLFCNPPLSPQGQT